MAQRMMQTGSRFERYPCEGTCFNECSDLLDARKGLCDHAAAANLCSQSVARERGHRAVEKILPTFVARNLHVDGAVAKTEALGEHCDLPDRRVVSLAPAAQRRQWNFQTIHMCP